MRTVSFVPGEFYHLYNRGVDKRDVFLHTTCYQRFYESLYLFNDKNYDRKNGKLFERVLQLAGAEVFEIDRKCLVSILAFKQMSNHFHLLVREEQEGGISEFMHRLGTGYTNFFNLQQGRTGSLFEGPFQAVHVKNEAHLTHLVRYIHLNELDRHGIPWREGEVCDWETALQKLDDDPYSSHEMEGTPNVGHICELSYHVHIWEKDSPRKSEIQSCSPLKTARLLSTPQMSLA